MTTTSVLVFGLLMVAVSAGWWIGRQSVQSKRAPLRTITDVYHDYFVGLNYLLRDEPDEAIDTFIRALEVNGETIETHLALGTLLRRRGKVDKAIKVHQTLLARPGLLPKFADSVQIELSNDYIAAGLLDRAERLLNELLIANGPFRSDALRQLVSIYQIEKEWQQAIGCVEKLLADQRLRKDAILHRMAAHFCCELADRALDAGDRTRARESIHRALQFDRDSVRAAFLAARVEQLSGDHEKAIRELLRIRLQRPRFLSEVIEPLAHSYTELGKTNEFETFLRAALVEEPRVSVILALCDLLQGSRGDTAALVFLSETMSLHPTLKGMSKLMSLQAGECNGQLQNNLKLLTVVIEKWLSGRPSYRCDDCGLETRNLYWQCPSCQKWDTITPILGIDGE